MKMDHEEEACQRDTIKCVGEIIARTREVLARCQRQAALAVQPSIRRERFVESTPRLVDLTQRLVLDGEIRETRQD